MVNYKSLLTRWSFFILWTTTLLLVLSVAIPNLDNLRAQNIPVNIMPLGNSITQGAGSSDETGYRRPLYLLLTGAGFNVDFVGTQTRGIPDDFDRNHEGHSGWHANQIRDSVYTWLVKNPSDIVLLHIGTNDISGGDEGVKEVEEILTNIDRYEFDYRKDVTVILARIILRTDDKYSKAIAFNNSVEGMTLKRIADGDDIILVDMENALMYSGDMADLLHPNDAGYEKIAEVWFKAIIKLLSEKDGL
jgi:lysophospholipase L1-like esterase